MQSVLRWRFEPASANGVAVPTVSMNTWRPCPPRAAHGRERERAQAARAGSFAATESPTGRSKHGAPCDRPRHQGRGARHSARLGASLPHHGVMFDRFHIGAVMARAQIVAGATPTPTSTGRGRPDAASFHSSLWSSRFPLTCDAARNPPLDMRFADATGRVLQKSGAIAAGAELSVLLPGVAVADGAIAASFPEHALPDATVTISNAPGGASSGTSAEAALHLGRQTPPRILERIVTQKLPDGMAAEPPTTVHVNFLVDADGLPRFATALDGPTELQRTAERRRRAAGATIPSSSNGGGVTDEHDRPHRLHRRRRTAALWAPGLRLGAAGPGGDERSAAARRDVARRHRGDATHDTLSIDIPGLTLVTSKCAVADDEQYGFTVGHPIKVGNDVFTGPAREVRYLNALRGPIGQGIHFRRVGSLPGPDQTILDAYEITYTVSTSRSVCTSTNTTSTIRKRRRVSSAASRLGSLRNEWQHPLFL